MKKTTIFLLALSLLISCMAGFSFAEDAELAKINNYEQIAASTEYNLAVINNISWQVKPDGVGEFANDGAYNGDVYCTGTVGAKATVTFYGSVFGVIVQRGGFSVILPSVLSWLSSSKRFSPASGYRQEKSLCRLPTATPNSTGTDV